MTNKKAIEWFEKWIHNHAKGLKRDDMNLLVAVKAKEALQEKEERDRLQLLEEKENDLWISVKDELPEPETEVIVRVEINRGTEIITTAIYEDGTIPEADSIWCWEDVDFDYDEENDRDIVPKGWWECRHYDHGEAINYEIDDTVTHWMLSPKV